ncbi:hypothetical protein L596_011621 [Steinernema carpocapsae]|uniref:Uncharacterized protein n=1 Tax=Steinernema carpocapsae TaxID=34508 RepID=A0A4V6A4K7_STECR|nr:hypothetical protein L596_011621 [Steinernema carpocapsae]
MTTSQIATTKQSLTDKENLYRAVLFDYKYRLANCLLDASLSPENSSALAKVQEIFDEMEEKIVMNNLKSADIDDLHEYIPMI